MQPPREMSLQPASFYTVRQLFLCSHQLKIIYQSRLRHLGNQEMEEWVVLAVSVYPQLYMSDRIYHDRDRKAHFWEKTGIWKLMVSSVVLFFLKQHIVSLLSAVQSTLCQANETKSISLFFFNAQMAHHGFLPGSFLTKKKVLHSYTLILPLQHTSSVLFVLLFIGCLIMTHTFQRLTSQPFKNLMSIHSCCMNTYDDICCDVFTGAPIYPSVSPSYTCMYITSFFFIFSLRNHPGR